MAKEKILIVDDETSIGEFLSLVLGKEGYRVRSSTSPVDALTVLEDESYDLLISDLRMPEMHGLEMVREARRRCPEMGVVVMTAFASLESAVEALRIGAADYITKPFHVDEIRSVVEKVLDGQTLRRENRRLKAQLVSEGSVTRLVGSSEDTHKLLELIKRVAPSDSTILITGESGTGKEVVAQIIHQYSERAKNEFVTVNCAALPDTLLESELFGHTRGSFTGAVRDKEGLFKIASGGTLFLDEIGDMTPSLQVKLLRALQEREILPLGATKPIKIDVRVIAATNADLDVKQKTGEFRSDLFYRLSVIPIHIKPLRARSQDTTELIDYFLEKSCRRHGLTTKSLSADCRMRLLSYSWPGNVRELENTIERAVILCETSEIDTGSLPGKMQSGESAISFGPEQELVQGSGTLEDVERNYLLQVLETTGWQKKRASEILGIDPSTIYRKLQRYGIEVPK